METFEKNSPFVRTFSDPCYRNTAFNNKPLWRGVLTSLKIISVISIFPFGNELSSTFVVVPTCLWALSTDQSNMELEKNGFADKAKSYFSSNQFAWNFYRLHKLPSNLSKSHIIRNSTSQNIHLNDKNLKYITKHCRKIK